MARPFTAQSHASATSAGVGEQHESKGHNSIGLFVVARNLDPANDTVEARIEGSPTGNDGEWALIETRQGGSVTTRLSLTTNVFDDPEGDGTYVGYIYAHGVPVEYLRVNLTSFTDSANSDLEVDTYIVGANNGGSGHSFIREFQS